MPCAVEKACPRLNTLMSVKKDHNRDSPTVELGLRYNDFNRSNISILFFSWTSSNAALALTRKTTGKEEFEFVVGGGGGGR